MSIIICARCEAPIAFGEPYHMVSNEDGYETYTHMARVGGTLTERCPKEEQADNDGPASPQVNSPAPSARTAVGPEEMVPPVGAPQSVVGAAPTPLALAVLERAERIESAVREVIALVDDGGRGQDERYRALLRAALRPRS